MRLVADGYRSIVPYLWGTAQTNSSDRYTGKELSNQYFQLHLLWVLALKGHQMDNGQNWNPFENGYGWNNLFSHRYKMWHHRTENCSQCTLRRRIHHTTRERKKKDKTQHWWRTMLWIPIWSWQSQCGIWSDWRCSVFQHKEIQKL